MLGSCFPIAAPSGAVALARPDNSSVFAPVYVALPWSSRPRMNRSFEPNTNSTPCDRTWSTFDKYEYSCVDPGASGRNCEMMASWISSWNIATWRSARSDFRSTRNSVASTSSGLRSGFGDVNVVPVDTSWYSSEAVANRYAFPTDAETVQKSDGVRASTPLGENFDAETVGWSTVVLPLTL